MLSNRIIITFIVLVLAGCSHKTVKINNRDYLAFDTESKLNTQYIKGYIGDYDGLISGRAYNVPTINFMWLDKNIVFSKYTKICIEPFDNLSDKKGVKYNSNSDELDISQTVTNTFFQDTQLRKLFKSVSRYNKDKNCNGIIVTGAVTDVIRAIDESVLTEVVLTDSQTNAQIGKLVFSASHVSFTLAANRVPGIIADVMEQYWVKSPGFDPKELIIKNKTINISNITENKASIAPTLKLTETKDANIDITNADTKDTKTENTTATQDDIMLNSTIMKVRDNNSKLRKKPSKNSDILKLLVKDENVTIVKQKDDWYMVELAGGDVGWCHKSILTSTK